jgi:ethanolamine ammonia-lyase small subunit
MEQDVENTAEHVLHLVRSRMDTEIPVGTAGTQNPSATRIVETFRARFAKACDAGVWKRLSNAVLEAANPFDVRAGRQIRQETLILGTLVFVALGLAVYFNVAAISR